MYITKYYKIEIFYNVGIKNIYNLFIYLFVENVIIL